MINLEYLLARHYMRKTLKKANKNAVENVGMSIVNKVLFYARWNGVSMVYPDGTKRFISNNWYKDEL